MKRTIIAASVVSCFLVTAGIGVPPDATPLPVDAQWFIRGDCNNDGAVNHADLIDVYVYLFNRSEQEVYARVALCPDAADANDDGSVDLGDAIYLAGWMYQEGPPPPAPFLNAEGEFEEGPDPTADSLYCYWRP